MESLAYSVLRNANLDQILEFKNGNDVFVLRQPPAIY
jgi:hypothetical protein